MEWLYNFGLGCHRPAGKISKNGASSEPSRMLGATIAIKLLSGPLYTVLPGLGFVEFSF